MLLWMWIVSLRSMPMKITRIDTGLQSKEYKSFGRKTEALIFVKDKEEYRVWRTKN